MWKHVWVVLSLIFSFSAHADDAVTLFPGFYQVSNGPVVYLYSDLVEDDDSGISQVFAVYQKGFFLKSEINKKDQIELQWKGGTATLLSSTPAQTIMAFRDEKTGVTAQRTFTFLGYTQAEAATALNLTQTFPVTDYLSHRGTAELGSVKSHSLYPGNTKKAMSLAIENGFSGFEFDVQLTKDGKFAVSHDEKLTVSSNCPGNVIDYNLEDVLKCEVLFTGFLPEKKIFHTRAADPEHIPSLEDVLTTYAPDSRVRHLTIDTKPGDIPTQIAAFDTLLKVMPAENRSKLIFLIRDLKIRDALRALGYTEPMYALEGSTGYEELETDTLPDGADAISLSIGLGLGFAGFKSGNLATALQVIWSGVGSLINGINPANHDHWRNGTIDLGAIHWSKRNEKKLLALMDKIRAANVRVIGWTVNTREKIKWLRANVADLPYLISDLPFSAIAELEAGELNKALKPEKVLP